MELKEIKKIEQSDIDNLRMLYTLIQSGEFTLKGDAIEQSGFLIAWMRELEGKMQGELKLRILAKAKPPRIKPIKKNK